MLFWRKSNVLAVLGGGRGLVHLRRRPGGGTVPGGGVDDVVDAVAGRFLVFGHGIPGGVDQQRDDGCLLLVVGATGHRGFDDTHQRRKCQTLIVSEPAATSMATMSRKGR